MTTRFLSLAASISFLLAGPVLAQADTTPPSASVFPKRYQFNVDAGPLEGGIGYAERLGAGPLSFGVGVWLAWEPAARFDRPFFEARGVEPFLRYQVSPSIQAEVGPSFLRYATGDDCSDCGATFIGLRVAALAGGRRLLFGPAVRYGFVTGRSTLTETGFVIGLQGRFFIDWAQPRHRHQAYTRRGRTHPVTTDGWPTVNTPHAHLTFASASLSYHIGGICLQREEQLCGTSRRRS